MARLLIALFTFVALVIPAKAQPVDGGRAVVELISDHAVAAPGETITLGLKLEMDPGWHVYWRNAGDAGLPPQIIWKDDGRAGSDIGDFLWPIPEELPIIPNEIMDYGYSDVLVLPFEVAVPADASGTLSFRGLADYLICEEICIPESAEVVMDVPVGAASLGTNAREIMEWRGKTPTDFAGDISLNRGGAGWTLSLAPTEGADLKDAELRFFPYEHQIVHSAQQSTIHGEAGACIALTEAKDGTDTSGNVDGIVVASFETGARFGYRVSASEGGLLANTCSERPVLTGGASEGIGSGNYSEGASGASATPSGGASSGGFNLLAILPFAFLGGLILNLMPCVLPVLSIKAIGMTQAATSEHKNELKIHGLAYTAGVLGSFATLAAAFLATRSALGNASLGFQLQHVPTVIGLIMIIFVIGLWLMGMFELGSSIQNTGSGLAARQGTAGAFFTGVLAAVVGAPCVGPFLGASLGAVINQPASTVMLTFLVLGFGMALPFLLISFLPGLQKLLPKPGAWMETLKQFFAFPMFLTAAWLLAVLGALTDYAVVGWTLAGASAIAFGIWALKHLPSGNMKPAVMGLGALSVIGGVAAPISIAMTPPPAPVTADAIVGDWSPEYVSELTGDGQGVFVDFTAVWCATCQVNKRTTLNRKDVKLAMAENDVAFLTADFTKRDPVIAKELEIRKRPGVPMYLYYPPGETEPQILAEILSPGYVIGLLSDK